MGTSGDDSSALIEFTPSWKTRVSNYPLKLKKRNLIGSAWFSLYIRRFQIFRIIKYSSSLFVLETLLNMNLLGSFFAKNESIYTFSFRVFGCKFGICRLSKTRNRELMTISMEMVRMEKSRPRKNQSECTDLPQRLSCHIIIMIYIRVTALRVHCCVAFFGCWGFERSTRHHIDKIVLWDNMLFFWNKTKEKNLPWLVSVVHSAYFIVLRGFWSVFCTWALGCLCLDQNISYACAFIRNLWTFCSRPLQSKTLQWPGW